MEEKKQHCTENLFEEKGGMDSLLNRLIERTVREKLESSETVSLDEDRQKNVEAFIGFFNRKYNTLKERIAHTSVKFRTASLEVSHSGQRWKELERIGRKLEEVKERLMLPTFDLLGPKVIEASRSAEQMAELLYRKRVSSDEFHEVVGALARWQVIDEVQSQLKPLDFGRCFAGFENRRYGGRPEDNLYELVDKERLRRTLEALHQVKYSMTVAQGWGVSQERTRQFLLAFMLSLYRRPLQALYGKMAAFCRFFVDRCGYAFVAVKNLQNWLGGYQRFVTERERRHNRPPQNEPQKAYNTWMRRMGKYLRIEALAQWMQGLLPQYGVEVV